AARDAGATTVLTPAPATPLPPELLAVVDVIVPNEHEVDLLGGVDALLASGVGAVVVTLGERGARVHTEGRVTQVESLTVDAVDTTGAGDTFTGYLAAGLSEGLDLVTAATRGCAAGALATTRAGAVPSIPSRAEVDAVSGV
ncbi:MAG: PfkB family carbohydrate kinase, partial [Ilumatobacter sp.]